MNAIYVFALTGQSTSPFTIEGHRIRFLDAGGVYAAIERLAERPAVSEAALRTQHDIVLALFERVESVLPARFGAWLEPRELKDLVTARHHTIREALELIHGRVQMTTRFPEMAAGTDMPPPSISSGADYLERKRQASRRLPPGAIQLSDAVRHLVTAERVAAPENRTGPAVYHLIDRARIAEYRARSLTALPPNATVTGPWPAFAFAPDLWP